MAEAEATAAAGAAETGGAPGVLPGSGRAEVAYGDGLPRSYGEELPRSYGPGARLVVGVRVYGAVAAMWVRSVMTYRASFAMTVFGNFAACSLDFVAIWLMFAHVNALGGFTLAEIALLYGSSGLAFGLADLGFGSMNRVGSRVRDGSMDALLLRPVPVLALVAADRFALRRLGRITQGAVVFGWALLAVDIDWTWDRALLVPLMTLSGAAIFSAVLVAGGAFQFLAQDAAEVANAFTYGGNTLLQYPPAIFGQDLVRAVTFVVPLAFVNWLPALALLGRPLPLGLPTAVAWTPPLVAVVCWLLAGAAWRSGLRSYRSTGS